jgi:peptidoglycan hydrolase CwlO-like protein
MDTHLLPEGTIVVFAAIVGNAILLIWHASSAISRLREHDKRLDKLETHSNDVDQKLERLVLDVEKRLGKIESSLESLSTNIKNSLDVLAAAVRNNNRNP